MNTNIRVINVSHVASVFTIKTKDFALKTKDLALEPGVRLLVYRIPYFSRAQCKGNLLVYGVIDCLKNQIL